MTDERGRISRRDFTALTLAAGIGAAAGAQPGFPAARAAEVIEADVRVPTPDGTCDAALAAPNGGGAWPAVIMFPDIFGLRPGMRAMAKRLASDGFTVLVPNPYYRSTKAPGITLDFDFNSPADRAKLDALRVPMTGGAVMRDAAAYVAFLDRQPSVSRKAPMGVVGYCMGGPMTLQAAAASPARIGAGASFHGGGLVTDQPASPHLLAPKIKAQFYFGIAASDDEKQPDAKDKLQAAFDAARVAVKIEVYEGTMHGWCINDIPMRTGKPIYDEAQAERAWAALNALYRRALA